MQRQRMNKFSRRKARKPGNRDARKTGPGPRADTRTNTVRAISTLQRGILHIPKNRFAPDSVIVELTYPDTTFTHNNVGFPNLSWRYRMTSIYDPDPLLGTGSIPGYSFWAAGYSGYRVLQIRYTIDISNLEGSPVDIIACPSKTDLGANYVNLNELFGNPYASQALLSAKGGMDRARLVGTIDIGEFYGSVNQYIGNDGFGGAFGANPTANFFLNVGGVSAANFTTGNGLDYRVTIVYVTHLLSLRTLTG